jgi:integrase
MFVRTRFQYGSLRLRKRERSTDVWEFRYYETSPVGKRIRQSVILGDQALYRTEADARKATQALLMRLNDEAPRAEMEAPTSGALLDRYFANPHELRPSFRIPRERCGLRPPMRTTPLATGGRLFHSVAIVKVL